MLYVYNIRKVLFVSTITEKCHLCTITKRFLCVKYNREALAVFLNNKEVLSVSTIAEKHSRVCTYKEDPLMRVVRRDTYQLYLFIGQSFSCEHCGKLCVHRTRLGIHCKKYHMIQ